MTVRSQIYRSMASKVPEDRAQEIKEAFYMFDPGNSGRMETKDLGTAVRSLGQNPSEAQIKAMIKEADRRDRGFIEFDDFVKTVSKHWNEVTSEEEIIECFKVFDREGSGYLEAKEFKKVLLNLGEQLTDEEVEDMLKVANLDQDGQLNYRNLTHTLLSSAK